MFYRPQNASVLADVIPYYKDGTYYIFFLNDYRDTETYGEGCPWNLITTKDFINFREYVEVIKRGKPDEQDLYVFTGSCIEKDGKYYIFYTAHNPHKNNFQEKIFLAVSDDLIYWAKDKSFSLQAPDWLEENDFRDPFVFYSEDEKCFLMLITAREKSGDRPDSRGVTVMAKSLDLINWDIEKTPFFAPRAYHTHECSDLFKIGDWWYYIFSEYSDSCKTTYRMSKSMNGPWQVPKDCYFDTRFFYAAKTVSDGKRRFLTGWNPIKSGEKDSGEPQWGGNLTVHELIQNSDGTLSVKCPDEVKNYYNIDIEIKPFKELGTVSAENGGYTLGSGYDKSMIVFNSLPDKYKLEIEFEATDDKGDFGILVRVNGNCGGYYYIKFEPKHRRAALARCENVWSKFIDIKTEKYCELKQNNKITAFVCDDILEVYINDTAALSARIYDFKGNGMGLCTNNTVVKFKNISVKGIKL